MRAEADPHRVAVEVYGIETARVGYVRDAGRQKGRRAIGAGRAQHLPGKVAGAPQGGSALHGAVEHLAGYRIKIEEQVERIALRAEDKVHDRAGRPVVVAHELAMEQLVSVDRIIQLSS